MAKSTRVTPTDNIPARRRAKLSSPPLWIKPQLAKLVETPPSGGDWIHEMKLDGYRMHARLDRGAVRMLTRTGLDWTRKYPTIAAAVASLPARQAYLDGELCGIRPDGTTSFSLIQNASDTGNTDALIFFSSMSRTSMRKPSPRNRSASGRSAFAPCCPIQVPVCTTAITRSRTGGPSTTMPARLKSKGSSRSESPRPTPPAIAACGLRSNA